MLLAWTLSGPISLLTSDIQLSNLVILNDFEFSLGEPSSTVKVLQQWSSFRSVTAKLLNTTQHKLKITVAKLNWQKISRYT